MTMPQRPTRRSTASDLLDHEVNRVLVEMLDTDTTITYRAIVRSIASISAPSSLTRDHYRRELIEYYQKAQQERRSWITTKKKSSDRDLIKSLSSKDIDLASAQEKIQLLIASHKASIWAVGEIGGMQAWLNFFENYQRALSILDVNRPLPLAKRRK